MFEDVTSRTVFALAILCGAAILLITLGYGIGAVAIAVLAGGIILRVALGPQNDADIAERLPRGTPLISQAFDALTDPVLILSGTSIIAANSTAKVLFHHALEGEDIRAFARHPAATELLANSDGLGQIEATGIGAPGQVWEVRAIAMDQQRRLVHLVDRTARHVAERARVDFVANASHELRTPLSTIIGAAETLQSEDAGSDKKTRKRFLDLLETEAKRMLALVTDLMSLSRIEAERHAAPKSELDLGLVVRTTAAEFDKATVSLTVPDKSVIVRGDAGLLAQMVRNLIDNALKYGKSEMPVDVSLEVMAGQGPVVRVQDHGEGIASEHLPRLTERFYRVDPGRSRTAGGTGLGLAIVKHIAQAHRAEFNIESRIGEGTCVSVVFSQALDAVT